MALCECGCGLTTKLAGSTRAAAGWVKGQPLRFVNGHQARKLVVKGYPSVTWNGRTMRTHRVRAELALGKPLPKGAQVHHVDGTKSARSPLVICQDLAYHLLLHARTRIVRAGGNPNTDRICCECKRVLVRVGNFPVNGNQCSRCQSARRRRKRELHGDRVRAYEKARRRPSGRVRVRYGSANARARLTEADVLAIRQSPAIGRVLAAQYGVSKSTIIAARRGQNWRWLTAERIDGIQPGERP